jgi:hypothetical protein
MSLFCDLVGKKIDAIWVMPGEQYLRIDASGESFVYETEGDCCSETWFAEIIGVDALIGATVTATEDLEVPVKEDGHTRQDSDEFYGQSIATDRGRAQIVYRNSSNGYYGGSASLTSTTPPGDWRQITDDWTACAA